MIVELYVVRHAVAEPAGPGQDDAARPLTADGAREFARAVAGLATLGVRLDLLLHSPALRAVETAELLVPLLERDGETRVTPSLARAPSPELLLEIARGRVALVGHEPWLGELALSLCLGWDPAGGGDGRPIALGKGSVAWLSGEPRAGAMSLRALWPSRALRAVGKRAR